MNNTNQQIKHYPILDLVRFIAALLVITIHIFPEGSSTQSVGFDNSVSTLLGLSFVFALTRIAVPIFFVISSFLLFRKIEIDPENKWKHIKRFCLRLLYLYLFWFIMGLPITVIDITTLASNGDNYNLIRYIVNFFWKGAPRGYWFLISLIVSVLLTSLFNNKKSLIVLTIIAGLLYVYGCFNAAYFNVIAKSDNGFGKALFVIGDYLELYCSHLQALIFVVLGKLFAIHHDFKIKGNTAFIILSFILMIGELFLTMYFDLFVYADAFFFLPVFIFFFMNKIITVDINNEKFSKVAAKLRKVGVFSYLFHVQFFYYMHLILDSINHNIFRDNIALLIIPYLVCILVCFGLQTLFEYLSKYKYLSFLKYSY